MNCDNHQNDDAPQEGEANVNETQQVENNDTGETVGGRPNRLLDLMRRAAENGDVELWHTPGRAEGFVTVACDGHREHLPIRSDAFRCWLLTKILNGGAWLGKNELNLGIEHLDALARYGVETEHERFVRVAASGGLVYIDLADEDRHVVQVSGDGWEIVTDPPVRFVRPDGMRSLPIPEHGGGVEAFRRVIGMEDEANWKLVVGFVLSAMRPTGPYPVLMLRGSAGSGKSTLTKMIRRILDPNEADLRSLGDELDTAIATRHSHLVVADNLSGLTQKQSDVICRLATGSGLGRRRLYTNMEEVLIWACNPVILNGVDPMVTKGGGNTDLLSRAIVVELPDVDADGRKTEAEMWGEFDDERGRILGALLDAVAGALGRRDDVELDGVPRMADAVVWVTAAERTLGWEEGSFAALLEDGQRRAEIEALEAWSVYPVLHELLRAQTRRRWTGTATELLHALDLQCVPPRPFEWPSNAASLSKLLKRHEVGLGRAGIEVRRERGRDQTRTRVLTLTLRVDVAGRVRNGGDAA